MALSNKSKDGVVEDYKGLLRGQEMALQAKVDPKVAAAIQSLSKNPEMAEVEFILPPVKK